MPSGPTAASLQTIVGEPLLKALIGHLAKESVSPNRGYIQTAEQKLLIEPMSDDADGDHAVLQFDEVHDKPMTCGVTNTSWDPEYPAKTSRSRSRAAVRLYPYGVDFSSKS